MSSSGASLERLVAEIESYLLPKGFSVESNVRQFDEGVPTAELDVVVTGAIGSSSVRWLFECRDRPSEGPAGVDWIEQLDGRRRRLLPDKVFAVSATGFTRPAVDFAERSGIVLRTVADASDVAGDFKVQSVCFDVVRLRDAEFDVRTPDGRKRDVPIDKTRDLVRVPASAPPIRVQDFLNTLVDRVRPDETPDAAPGVETFVRFYLYGGPGAFVISGQVEEVSRLRVRYTVERERVCATAVTVLAYSEASRVIAREGTFVFPLVEGPLRLRVQIIERGEHLDIRTFFDEKSDALHLSRLTVWGQAPDEDEPMVRVRKKTFEERP